MKKNVLIRTVGDYFGERSILLSEKRTATAIARGETSCWVLSKLDFVQLTEAAPRAELLKRLELQDDSVAL